MWTAGEGGFVYNIEGKWYQTNMNINFKVKYIYNHWKFVKWVGVGVNLCLLIQPFHCTVKSLDLMVFILTICTSQVIEFDAVDHFFECKNNLTTC